VSAAIAPWHAAPGRRFGASGALALGLPIVAAGVAAWDPARHGGPTLCPIRALTGVPCPGCGLTRATGALLRGRWGDAIDLHPLILLAALQLAIVWGLVVLAFARGALPRPVGQHVRVARRPPAWVMPAVLALNAIAFVSVWAVRLSIGSLA
jgi:hypothetical protein